MYHSFSYVKQTEKSRNDLCKIRHLITNKNSFVTVSGNNFGLMSGSREKNSKFTCIKFKEIFLFGDDFKTNECASVDTRFTRMNKVIVIKKNLSIFQIINQINYY